MRKSLPLLALADACCQNFPLFAVVSRGISGVRRQCPPRRDMLFHERPEAALNVMATPFGEFLGREVIPASCLGFRYLARVDLTQEVGFALCDPTGLAVERRQFREDGALNFWWMPGEERLDPLNEHYRLVVRCASMVKHGEYSRFRCVRGRRGYWSGALRSRSTSELG